MAHRSRLEVEPAKPAGKSKAVPNKGKTVTSKSAERGANGRRQAAGPLAMVHEAEEICKWVCGWEFELAARAYGSMRVAGVDEVGRGPLFGPVVAAAVILPEGAELEGLNDSKQLTEEEREHFNERVREIALAFAVAEVDVRTIDRINILQASRLAMKVAVEALGIQPDHLLIDGNQKIDYCPPGVVCRQTTIVQGDARSLSIAAASVIAKVHRDRLLCELDAVFPGYGLARNKGYGTPEHKEALLRLGITEMHRRSFAPVAELFEVEVEGIEVGLFED